MNSGAHNRLGSTITRSIRYKTNHQRSDTNLWYKTRMYSLSPPLWSKSRPTWRLVMHSSRPITPTCYQRTRFISSYSVGFSQFIQNHFLLYSDWSAVHGGRSHIRRIFFNIYERHIISTQSSSGLWAGTVLVPLWIWFWSVKYLWCPNWFDAQWTIQAAARQACLKDKHPTSCR